MKHRFAALSSSLVVALCVACSNDSDSPSGSAGAAGASVAGSAGSGVSGAASAGASGGPSAGSGQGGASVGGGGGSPAGGGSAQAGAGGSSAGGGNAGAGGAPSKTTFFVTSDTSKTGNLGGLLAADMRCQKLATAAGFGSHTFHAYLSA